MRYGVEVLASNFYECICTVYTGICPTNHKDRRTTLPSLPGQRDTEERGYINASHHGGSSCRVTGSDGRFSLPSQSCANLDTELSNSPQSNSPMPVLPTMQSDDVRQENMATVLNINIPLKCFKRKAIYPLNNCRTSGFYGSLFLV